MIGSRQSVPKPKRLLIFHARVRQMQNRIQCHVQNDSKPFQQSVKPKTTHPFHSKRIPLIWFLVGCLEKRAGTIQFVYQAQAYAQARGSESLIIEHSIVLLFAKIRARPKRNRATATSQDLPFPYPPGEIRRRRSSSSFS